MGVKKLHVCYLFLESGTKLDLSGGRENCIFWFCNSAKGIQYLPRRLQIPRVRGDIQAR